MTKRKAGLTKEERTSFLRDNGWEQEREGKGSHSMWVHPELKALGQNHKIELPVNLAHTEKQPAWSLLLAGNPASGTWSTIEKHVNWCSDKIAEIKANADNKLKYRSIREQFNNAVKGVKDWKHETKHRLKLALAPNPAPEAYHLMPAIVKAKRDLKGGL